MTVEKRFHQRMNIDIDAHIVYRDRHIIATVKNITPYGILLSADKLSVPNGMLLEISIEVNDRITSMSGLVIWSNQNKIGIMFPHAQFALFTAAESYVDKNMPVTSTKIENNQVVSIASKHRLFQPEPHIQA